MRLNKPHGQAISRGGREMSDERGKTLSELEGQDWGPLPSYQSSLVETVHQLRHKPIGDFTVEDLRITIGQQIGIRWLVPIAIKRLIAEPLCEGDLYPGDLLDSVLRVDHSYWSRNLEARKEITLVAEAAIKQLDESSDGSGGIRDGLLESLVRFGREPSD